MIRIALIDDEPAFRLDLIKFLETAGDMRCVCECGTVEEAIKHVPLSGADVVLMDLELKDQSGIDCIRKLKPKIGTRPVLVLTVPRDNERIFQALAAGAYGYCLKGHVPARLLAAIRDVHAGGGHFSPEVARKVARFHHEPAPAESLTPAEQRVLELLKTTMSLNGIAQVVRVTLDTVKTHTKRIYEKLGVHSRAELRRRFGINPDEGLDSEE